MQDQLQNTDRLIFKVPIRHPNGRRRICFDPLRAGHFECTVPQFQNVSISNLVQFKNFHDLSETALLWLKHRFFTNRRLKRPDLPAKSKF